MSPSRSFFSSIILCKIGFIHFTCARARAKEIIKRFEEEDSKPVSAFTPVGKGDKKLFVELIQQSKDEENTIGEIL